MVLTGKKTKPLFFVSLVTSNTLTFMALNSFVQFFSSFCSLLTFYLAIHFSFFRMTFPQLSLSRSLSSQTFFAMYFLNIFLFLLTFSQKLRHKVMKSTRLISKLSIIRAIFVLLMLFSQISVLSILQPSLGIQSVRKERNHFQYLSLYKTFSQKHGTRPDNLIVGVCVWGDGHYCPFSLTYLNLFTKLIILSFLLSKNIMYLKCQ